MGKVIRKKVRRSSARARALKTSRRVGYLLQGGAEEQGGHLQKPEEIADWMVGEVGVVGGALCWAPRTFLRTLAIYLAKRCDFFKCKSLCAGSSRCCTWRKLPGHPSTPNFRRAGRVCDEETRRAAPRLCLHCCCCCCGRRGWVDDAPDVTLFQVFSVFLQDVCIKMMGRDRTEEA